MRWPKTITITLIPSYFSDKMRFPPILALLSAYLTSSNALNILVNNDDGFGSANTRELYRLLRAAGHDAWMVAPAVDNSGQCGRLIFTPYPELTNETEFGLVPAGAPSLGPDPHDSHIWYYNGTPAACTAVVLAYVLPTFAEFSVPDLFVSGPKFRRQCWHIRFHRIRYNRCDVLRHRAQYSWHRLLSRKSHAELHDPNQHL